MANSTYDNMWQQAMGELSEQLHVEGVDDGDEGGEGGGGNSVSYGFITSIYYSTQLTTRFLSGSLGSYH